MLRDLLKECIEGRTLTEYEAETIMNQIMRGEATASQIASLLSMLRLRGETVDELTGFAKAMRKHMKAIPTLSTEHVIDTCGTGGDGVSSFNISTATALVVSALGVKVAKHGNRAVSSKSGSADVLEYLGIPIQTTPEDVSDALEKYSMSFLFAPNYHSAMRHAAETRREIGFRTAFNLLGPLSNPARCKRQVIGVYDTKFAEKMAKTLQRLGSTHVLFVTGRDGLDEITVTTETDIVELKNNEIFRYTIHPHEFGLPIGNLVDIQTSSVEQSGEVIKSIFHRVSNESATNIVLINAGAALYVSGIASSIHQGIILAKEALDSYQVLYHFLSLVGKKEEHRYA
ncbi:anthranilate phosphoribosyltransferase [Bacillus salitolerans]|uniref:Anthranilate phosphoribosyltransferase n=1 Tax=Bacillus salitolerans TaxID=1437434 RepID=A0ABW4LVD5_9BACI